MPDSPFNNGTVELAIIAVLAVKNRVRQLRSHIRGALMVGVSMQLIDRLFNALKSHFALPDFKTVEAICASVMDRK